MNKGLAAALLFVSTVYAGSYEDFKEELKVLEQKSKAADAVRCDNCDVHVRIKEVIDYNVKQYYLRESQSPWYEEVDALNKSLHDNYCQNFRICINVVKVDEWKHEPSLTLETITQEAFFIMPEDADAVVGLTWLRPLLTPTIGRTEVGGNYLVMRVDKEDGISTYIHEFGHLFGAGHVDDTSSIMYENGTGSLHWDRKSIETVLSNKSRSWELDETRLGLHMLISSMDAESTRKLKKIYRALGLQSLVKDKHAFWETIENDIQKLIVLNPNEGHLRFLHAEIYMKQGNEKDAISEYEKALESGTKYAVLQNNLAYYHAEKDPVRALALAQNAVKKKPSSEDFRETLGWAYYNNGRYEEAEKEFVQLKTLQNNAEYQYHLGMTYDKLQKLDKAKLAFEKVVKIDNGRFKQVASEKLETY